MSFGKRLLLAAVFVFGVAPLAGYVLAGNRSGEPARDSTERFNAVGRETQVLVAKEDSEGVTNEDLTTEAATRVGDYSLERMRFHTQRILDEMNSKESADAITADSVLITAGTKNIIVTRFHFASKVPYIQFFGINGSETVRVLCMAKPTEDVIIAGNCLENVEEIFGVSLVGLTTGRK